MASAYLCVSLLMTVIYYESVLCSTVAEYGSWVSPITSETVTADVISFTAPIMVDPVKRDTVYWVQSQPAEGGRSVVVSYKDGDIKSQTWTPPGFNVITRVHSYGGGAFFVYDGSVYFSNAADQRLYVQRKQCDLNAEPLTPAGKAWRYADGQFYAKINLIVIVREDHEVKASGEREEEENSIVAIHPDTKEQFRLVDGADFYSNPRVSPDGKKLCWIQWNHPDMPWDFTELWTAEFNDDMTSLKPDSFEKIASGASIMQPMWTKHNTLVYISDKTDWWNLYKVSKKGVHTNIAPQSREIGLPPWTFGNRQYSLRDGHLKKMVTLFGGELQKLDGSSGKGKTVSTGYGRHFLVEYGQKDIVYCLAGSPDKPTSIIRVDIKKCKVTVLQESTSVVDTIGKGYISIPDEVQYRTANNATVYAFYYPPQNRDYEGPETSRPPLLIKSHSGPTSATFATFKSSYQFFTSRGFAVMDVNYRGSTGKGRQYRVSLYKNWGIYDNEDVVYGARYMQESGRADGDKLAISGESAGGYTTLSSLAFWPGVFTAAASYFGISDLMLLIRQTHKFESRYTDKLIGPYPESAEVYEQRSPINYIDNITTPCIFLHGTLDPVVPPNQAQLMFDALREKGISTALVLFPGEYHGLRAKKNQQKALASELYFYSVVYGFMVPGISVNVSIVNRPETSANES